MGSKSLKIRAMCMADGGTVQKESPEQLMARMAAKYKIASADTQQVPQPAPQAEQSPAQRTAGQGIVSLLKGRGRQIDRAAGYADGGIVARAFQFKGKGGPTDDEIPVKVAGQNINVSNGEKAVVLPAKTAQNPQAVSAIEDIIEQSNGKPTNRQGNNFAAGGLFENTSRTWDQAGKDVGESVDRGEYSKAFGKSLRGSLATSVGLTDDVIGTPVRMAAGAVSDFASGLLGRQQDQQATPVVQGAAKQAAPQSVAAQQSTPTVPQVAADKPAVEPVDAAQQPAIGGLRKASMPLGSKAPDVFDELGNKIAGGNISGQKLYTNVSGKSTQGMSAMDAPLANVPGSSPIPTVPGLSLSQRAGNPNLGTADDNMRQLENIQKANAMMTPQGGVSVLADPNEAANSEKTARWRQDELIGALKQSGNRHGKSALGQALSAQISGQNGLAAETLRQQTARDAQSMNANNAAVTQGLTRRAQDQAAARDADRMRIEEQRLAGNPLDNQDRQLEINRKARINALQEQAINGKTDEEKQSAIKALNSLSGRQESKYKALTAGGGKNAMGEVMPERVVVVDENTGRFINEGAPQAGDMLAEARAAIAKGADRAAVNARLKQAGIKETL